MFRKLAAECFGTFWLVFGGCGSAVLAAGFPELGIGFAGVALAFGLTVLTMAFAVGHISGGHFNPAVTIGLWAGGRFPAKEVVGYVIAQVVGGIVAAALLYLIASGKTGFDAAASGFASNGYGEHSPGGYSMLSALVVELVLSAGFLLVIHGATDKFAPAGFAPIAIGLALTLIHLISIPVTNTSVNPARSTAVAIFQGGWALEQLWFFWVVPIVGGIIGGLIYRTLLEKLPDIIRTDERQRFNGLDAIPQSFSFAHEAAAACSMAIEGFPLIDHWESFTEEKRHMAIDWLSRHPDDTIKPDIRRFFTDSSLSVMIPDQAEALRAIGELSD